MSYILTSSLDEQRESKYILSLLTKAAKEPLPEGMVVPESFEELVAEVKEKTLDSRASIMKLKAMVSALHAFICHCRHSRWLLNLIFFCFPFF